MRPLLGARSGVPLQHAAEVRPEGMKVEGVDCKLLADPTPSMLLLLFVQPRFLGGRVVKFCGGEE